MMHALIIEDESLIAMTIEDILRDCGFTSFDVAVSNEGAIAAAALRCPDLITADVELRPGCGIDAVNVICAGPPVPVIFITGSSSEVTSRLPHHSVVVKPFTTEEVMTAVEAALAASRTRISPCTGPEQHSSQRGSGLAGVDDTSPILKLLKL